MFNYVFGIKDIIIIILLLIIFFPFKKLKSLLVKNKVDEEKFKHDVNMDTYLKNKNEIDLIIKKDIKTEFGNEKKMRKLIKYSLDDGKRVRGVIISAIFKQLSKQDEIPDYVKEAILTMEYIHAASLIIDDMMDGDTDRRGKKCIHIKYGSTMAQLVALQLISLCYQKLCCSINLLNKQMKDSNKNICLILNTHIANNLKSLSIGQYIDINIPNDISKIGKSIKETVHHKQLLDVEDLIHKKTSSLFMISFVWPWLLYHNSKTDEELDEDIKNISEIAKLFGLIFQIADDFEDEIQDYKKQGKNSVMNYVIYHGKETAKVKYYQFVDKFFTLSEKNNILTQEIREIISYLNSKVDHYSKL